MKYKLAYINRPKYAEELDVHCWIQTVLYFIFIFAVVFSNNMSNLIKLFMHKG